ncbi:MAG: DUF222 domain-containing protein [Kofleriaceae bacterium]|nr:DUF222 domain-containing protein [Kofleriaceae bacterium]
MPHAGLHGSAEPSALAMMADGEIIAATTARRLSCDAGVVVAHVDAQGAPLSVGRKTRTIPAAIKRALLRPCGATPYPRGAHHYGQHQRIKMDWRIDQLSEVYRLFGLMRGGRASGQHQGLQHQGLRRW